LGRSERVPVGLFVVGSRGKAVIMPVMLVVVLIVFGVDEDGMVVVVIGG
jgi:predicted permease